MIVVLPTTACRATLAAVAPATPPPVVIPAVIVSEGFSVGAARTVVAVTVTVVAPIVAEGTSPPASVIAATAITVIACISEANHPFSKPSSPGRW